jgi:hypothetical protein
MNSAPGRTLKWDYKKCTCNKFQHTSPNQLTHSPSKYGTPVYGANTQYATRDETASLDAEQCMNIQRIAGSVLYYVRAVSPTVLVTLNEIATEETKVTDENQAATDQLLDYLAMHPDATISYHASDMLLHIHSDVSHLSVSNARSRIGGLFFCGKITR